MPWTRYFNAAVMQPADPFMDILLMFYYVLRMRTAVAMRELIKTLLFLSILKIPKSATNSYDIWGSQHRIL